MQDIEGHELLKLDRCWLTIGAFDGVHLGHQKMVQRLVEGAKFEHQPAVVVTFHPHPQVVLKKISTPFYLTLPSKRSALLRALGVDFVITLQFDEALANLSAREFLLTLHKHLHPSRLIVGPDFALGKDRGGITHVLRDMGLEFNYDLEVTEPVFARGDLVSSSRIRKLIMSGALNQAEELLGRAYAISGKIGETADQTRRQFLPAQGSLLPPPGIYATRIAAGLQLTADLIIDPEHNSLKLIEPSSSAILPGDEVELIFTGMNR